MSKNAFSDSNKCWKPDNPQEMFEVQNYYYSGFFAAEMSCSVIKATNYNPVGHYYYAVDITVSNADKILLREINKVVMKNSGVISPVKGAFNLSARGKRRVSIVLDFFDRYPIIIGDLAKNRIALIRDALGYLETHRGLSKHQAKGEVMDDIRKKLRKIKTSGITLKSYKQECNDKNSIGYFLAGILDGEGSFGFKKSGNRKQPFLAVAMKDQKIIELFKKFLECRNVRKRKDGVYHYEINRPQILQKVCKLFLTKYPLCHKRQRERLQALQQILNDYTQNSTLELKKE